MIKVSDIRCDIHTHTLASGHAYGTIREMAEGAKEKNLELLGFSEHAPGIPGTCTEVYFSNLKVAPRKLHGVEILYGCELNVMNDRTFSLPEKYLEMLDYAIVGIHTRCYEDAGKEKNTENLIAYMRHPKVCLVSHPDDDNTPLDYERLVAAAKEYHVALEVNNSTFLKMNKRLNCLENYKTMLRLCEKYMVPVIVSSDAHDPAYVGHFDEACAFLNEVGFSQELLVNISAERFKMFIK